MITDEIKEQIKEAADIVEVVSDRVKLKRSGNGFTGLCPFHNEKSPSFHVSPHLGIYKCFGCGRAGDVFNFVMETEGVSFPEAMKALASRYNIYIPEDDAETDDPRRKEKEGVFHALKFAAAYYHQELRESEDAGPARAYLVRRGLQRELIKEYLLGYSHDTWQGLLNAAKSAGINETYLFQAGLLKESDQGREPYDAFRGRVMFPIINTMGRVIAFGGRLMGDAKQAKYINSPQTLVYNKSEALYGIHVAKNEIRKHEEAILVEGYMDVLQLHQAGIKNVVSTSGTALTPQQVAILHRFGEKLTAIFDADQAGQNAMNRAIPIALEEGLAVNLLKLPDGEDPDTFVKQFGKEGFLGYKRQHEVDFIHYLIQSAQLGDWDNPRYKKQTVARAIQLISLVKDPIERETLVQELHELTAIGDRTLMQELNLLMIAKERKDKVDRRTAAKDEREQRSKSLPHPTTDTFNPAPFSSDAPPSHLQDIPIGDEYFHNNYDDNENERNSLDDFEAVNDKKYLKEKELLSLIFNAPPDINLLLISFILTYSNLDFFQSTICKKIYTDIKEMFIRYGKLDITYFTNNNDLTYKTWVSNIIYKVSLVSQTGDELVYKSKNKKLEYFECAQSTLKLIQVNNLEILIENINSKIKSSNYEGKQKDKELYLEMEKKLNKLKNSSHIKLFPIPNDILNKIQ